jgi:hypothetical protein
VTSVVGTSTGFGSVVDVDGGTVVTGVVVVGVVGVLDVGVGAVVVVGSGTAGGHERVARASSPHAYLLAVFHAPSTSTALLTNGYGVSRWVTPSAITE